MLHENVFLVLFTMNDESHTHQDFFPNWTYLLKILHKFAHGLSILFSLLGVVVSLIAGV